MRFFLTITNVAGSKFGSQVTCALWWSCAAGLDRPPRRAGSDVGRGARNATTTRGVFVVIVGVMFRNQVLWVARTLVWCSDIATEFEGGVGGSLSLGSFEPLAEPLHQVKDWVHQEYETMVAEAGTFSTPWTGSPPATWAYVSIYPPPLFNWPAWFATSTPIPPSSSLGLPEAEQVDHTTSVPTPPSSLLGSPDVDKTDYVHSTLPVFATLPSTTVPTATVSPSTPPSIGLGWYLGRGYRVISNVFHAIIALRFFVLALRLPNRVHGWILGRIRSDGKWFPAFAAEPWELERLARGEVGVVTSLRPESGAVLVRTTKGRGKRVTENGLIVTGSIVSASSVADASARYEQGPGGTLVAKLHICRHQPCKGAASIAPEHHRSMIQFVPVSQGASSEDIVTLAQGAHLKDIEWAVRHVGWYTDWMASFRLVHWIVATLVTAAWVIIDIHIPYLAIWIAVCHVTWKLAASCCSRRTSKKAKDWDSDDSVDLNVPDEL